MKKDGGPAFPLDVSNTADSRAYDGMTLRDWFAGRLAASSLQAIMTDETLAKDINKLAAKAGLKQYAYLAERAYAFADAMLAERERGDK